jgi:hypothetical protein
MKAKKFILNELNALIKQFDSVKLRYKYDEDTTTHVIEVTPKTTYDSNDFISQTSEMWSRFFARFPHEGMCFIPDDFPVGIDDIAAEELTLQGVSYSRNASETQKPSPVYRQTQKRTTFAAATL